MALASLDEEERGSARCCLHPAVAAGFYGSAMSGAECDHSTGVPNAPVRFVCCPVCPPEVPDRAVRVKLDCWTNAQRRKGYVVVLSSSHQTIRLCVSNPVQDAL